MSTNRIEFIAEMLAKNPTDTYLNSAAALEYVKEGDPKKAIRIFRKLIKLDPNYLPTYYQLGTLLEESGKADEAIRLYRKGLALAKKRKDVKTIGELSEALLILDADVEHPW